MLSYRCSSVCFILLLFLLVISISIGFSTLSQKESYVMCNKGHIHISLFSSHRMLMIVDVDDFLDSKRSRLYLCIRDESVALLGQVRA